MSNISKAFDHGKAFIPFITCGDPDLETTKRIVVEMEKAGADLIELGIPFSDPTAEGAVIMEANMRALAGGVTSDDVFQMVRQLRREEGVQVPMVFMTYANVLFSYGKERFIANSLEAGMDGFILPDVPYEEKDEFDSLCREAGLDLISMIAPTSMDRVRRIAADAEGFLYCVSSLGVTGTRDSIGTDISGMIDIAKAEAPQIPCAVGFGISTPQQAAQFAEFADGVIVGSAIVKLCAQYASEAPEYIGDYIRSMKAAMAGQD
ncbi:MAG: tryptophan synthase subunit alpha [Firmicutes bacterium]|nr:tryptophan synthase subunit alpha [Bacillota bacterium]